MEFEWNGRMYDVSEIKKDKDGYTIILLPTQHVYNPSIYDNMPYDPIKDFSPITMVGAAPLLLAGGIVLTVIYVLTISSLGFFLATIAYLALFMLIGRYRNWTVIAVSSVLGSLTLVFIFMKVVYVSLPLGSGPFESVSAFLMNLLGIH